MRLELVNDDGKTIWVEPFIENITLGGITGQSLLNEISAVMMARRKRDRETEHSRE